MGCVSLELPSTLSAAQRKQVFSREVVQARLFGRAFDEAREQIGELQHESDLRPYSTSSSVLPSTYSVFQCSEGLYIWT